MKFTPETRARAQETADAKREVRKRNILYVGDWRVHRLDDFNIVVEKEGGKEIDRGHYPDTQTAIKALFRKMSEPAGRLEAKGLLLHMQKAEQRITDALSKSSFTLDQSSGEPS